MLRGTLFYYMLVLTFISVSSPDVPWCVCEYPDTVNQWAYEYQVCGGECGTWYADVCCDKPAGYAGATNCSYPISPTFTKVYGSCNEVDSYHSCHGTGVNYAQCSGNDTPQMWGDTVPSCTMAGAGCYTS